MHTRLRAALALAMMLVPLVSLHAQEEGQRLELGGALRLDDRLSTYNGQLSWQEYRLSLTPSYTIDGRVKFYSDVWVRRLISSSPFETKPGAFQLREAYVELYGFLLKNLDITVGRQRIAWGTADRLNPTDNVNPVDLEDFWDVGRHMPTNSLQARCYMGPFTLTGVFTPHFEGAVLPTRQWLEAVTAKYPRSFDVEVPMAGTVRVKADPVTMSWHDEAPGWSLKNATYAVKLGCYIRNFSLSLSWLRQPMPMPVPSSVNTEARVTSFSAPTLTATVSADVKATLSHPIRQVVGFDVAGAIGSVGVWGEAALFLPEHEVRMERAAKVGIGLPGFPLMGQFPLKLSDSLVLAKEPYVKYTVGADYTFPINLYVNLQYAHGMAHEEGRKALHDYLSWVAEWTSDDARIKLAPLNGMLRVDEFDDVAGTYALFALPELTYTPIDNLDLKVGAHILLTGKQSALHPARHNGDAYCQVIYSF